MNVDAKDFDLEETVWWLQKHPIDHTSWDVENSHRKDIEMLFPNFRGQLTKEVLSPAEVGADKHAGNCFGLDHRGNGGNAQIPEISGCYHIGRNVI
jgi:hypothetical protein